MSTTRKIETIVDDLIRASQSGHIMSAAEITSERRSNLLTWKQGLHTRDFAIYRVEDKGDLGQEVVIHLGGRSESNPLFDNPEKAMQQLTDDGHYHPPQWYLDNSRVTDLRFNYSELGLKDETNIGHPRSYLEIDTKRYNSTLNESQRGFAEAFYGKGDDFVKAMRMFSEAGVKKARIYVLTADDVKKSVGRNNALATACYINCLMHLGGKSEVYANSTDVRNMGFRIASPEAIEKIGKNHWSN